VRHKLMLHRIFEAEAGVGVPKETSSTESSCKAYAGLILSMQILQETECVHLLFSVLANERRDGRPDK
jgi:hypothetical protein